MGIDGAAVVSAVVSQPDIEKAAKDLRELCEDCFEDKMLNGAVI